MISAGLEGRLHFMTYPEPWRGPPKQPPEFLRPAPKSIPSIRFNGVSSSMNGLRLPPSSTTQRTLASYPSPPITTPVNLTQHKDEVVEELPFYRLYPAPPHLPHFPSFTTIYQNSHYSHMIRPTYPRSSLSSLESFSPTTPTTISPSSFMSPPPVYSPTSPAKSGQTILRDKRVASQVLQSTTQIQHNQESTLAFKVPTGKEGSLKHRILTRPEDVNRNSTPLDLQKCIETPRKRLNATMSPPRSPKISSNNNNLVSGNFTKGSLIQLANGDLRRIEDLRTEDFVTSAEHTPEVMLADSTVVRIEENLVSGTATITLSYNQRRTQVDIETTSEHPYFVFGQGWASCNPEKTQHCYRLKVHRLQVGDVLISLTPRNHFTSFLTPRSTTIMTTATSTAMTVRPIDSTFTIYPELDQSTNNQVQPINLHGSAQPSEALLQDSLSLRKRSALNQICDDEEQHSIRKHRLE